MDSHPALVNPAGYVLPSVFQLPPFSGCAVSTFLPSLPPPNAIPPMGKAELEQLAGCAVVISRAIVVNMVKEQGWKFTSCSHCQELGQQVSWLLIGCTRVNDQSEARSAS